MVTNVGVIDRVLRIVIGLGLIVATLLHYLPWWGWIGVVPLVTGVFAWCPAYSLLGFNTCKRSSPT
jgi:hypothetical protein